MSLNGSLGGVGNSGSGSSSLSGSTGSSSSSLPTLARTGATGSINFTGIASGLNTNEIVQELLQADQIPITNLQDQESNLNNQLTIYQEYATALQALGSAAGDLNSASAFQPITASSSDTSVATVTTSTGASAGNYNLTVNQLAQAEMISSSAQQSATAALGLSGTIVVNGQGIQVGTGDSLTSIAQKINETDSGVTASIISGGPGSDYLTLASNNTGVANNLQIADLQGSVANTLGLISGTATARDSSGGADLSYGFTSQTEDLSTLLNGSAMGTDTFSINGVNVSVDTTSTSLQGLASAINAANTGATASIVTGTSSNGATTYQLKLTGATSFTDSNNLLQGVGVLQQGYANQVTQGQDAKYVLDNVNMDSASNTVSNVLQGVSIQLLQGTPTDPGQTTISLSQNTSAVTTSIQNFVTAYNNLQSFVSQESGFNSSTYATGPLFGDPTTQQIQGQLSNDLFDPVAGLQPPYNNLASIGVSLSQSGTLSLDSSQLQTALSQDPTAVQNLFIATGTGSTPDLNFITSGANTVSSGDGQYAVNITQAATEGVFTASTAQTQPLAQNETLTFSGALLGNTNYTLDIQRGETQQDVVNQINSDATLKGLVTASVQNGLLTIASQQYGSNGNFSVSSDTAASSSSSGIQGGSFVNGLDVEGTINGEAASGNGQYLTGKSGNTTTDGLEIQYTGTSTGNVGSISFTNGIGAIFNNAVNSFTDPTTGLIADAENSINSQVSSIQTQVTQLQTEMNAEQAQLQTEFANMETAMATLQQQQKELSAELGQSTTSSSSTSSSSSSSI